MEKGKSDLLSSLGSDLSADVGLVEVDELLESQVSKTLSLESLSDDLYFNIFVHKIKLVCQFLIVTYSVS